MKFVAIDTETTGLRMFHPRDRVIMISVCDGGTPTLHKTHSKYVKEILEDPCICKMFYNAKFDVPMLRKEGYVIRGPVWCLMVMAQMTLPELPQHGLKFIARKISGTDYKEETALALWQGKGKNKKMMWDAPAHILRPYALKDAKETFDLYPPLLEGLKEKGMVKLYLKEMKVLRVVSRMEERGILIDIPRTTKLLSECQKELKELKMRLCEITEDYQFNPNSPIQVAKHVYKNGVYASRFSKKTGQPRTDRVSLLQLNTELARGVARYRELGKSGNTYLTNILKGVDEQGTFRAGFNQARAITGRFSSSGYGGLKFNLQNIPRPDDRKGALGRIRECFIARPGYRLFFIDMDQIEMRLLAHFTQDKRMIHAIHNGIDLHNSTCEKMFDIDEDHKDWKLMRYLAKTLNFLIVYGGREERLQETVYDQTGGELSIPLEDCADYVHTYWDAHPDLQTLFDKIADVVSEHGGITNPYGRFCPVKATKSYVGVNYLIQGTAADYLKEAMLRCAEHLKGCRSRMLMTIHDELVFEIHHTEKKLVRLLKDAMEDFETFSVPLTAGVESGYRWGKKKIVVM